MFFGGVDSPAVFNPDLLGLTDQGLGMSRKESDLPVQFFRQPEIVRIKEGDICPPGPVNTRVAGGTDALFVLPVIRVMTSAYGARAAGVSSVEPSSTTISSKSVNVWARTASTAWQTIRLRLKVGMMTLT